jgi:succinate dehydrogenase / fumarate reductase cytochrome b subunit
VTPDDLGGNLLAKRSGRKIRRPTSGNDQHPDLQDVALRPGEVIHERWQGLRARSHPSEEYPMSNGSRPLSPHLQIYRPQITSVLSICHRITGIFLSVGAIVLVWWLLAAAQGPESYARAAGFLGSFFGLLFLFGWTYALWFHFCAGIRHLVWDVGYGLEIPQVYLGGWIVVGASVGLTILTWIVALIVW